jgi:hypothetical protein
MKSENTAPVNTAPNLDDELAHDDDAMAEALASGQKTTGGFEGPSWVPMLAAEHSDLKEAKRVEKVEKAGKGSTTRQLLRGRLVAEFAWGRRLYFLDVPLKGGKSCRVKLPESRRLWDGLNLCALGSDVAVRYDGRGKAKAGRQAAHLFSVAVVGGKALPAPRSDAMIPESMDEREAKRKARERAERKAKRDAEAVADDDDDLDGDDVDGVDFP